ncbi:MAG: GxxExxY protein [Acetobacteraceae bacterium]|nr:GxxExxY protein [Acetobacteraceae bacterium]
MHAEHADSDRLNDLSGRLIGCAFTVLNTLGAGFLEKVHENALRHLRVRRASACTCVEFCLLLQRHRHAMSAEIIPDRRHSDCRRQHAQPVRIAMQRC